jgi:hypothetical protein
MADRSNVGERVLGARKTTQGSRDALENIVGHALHDGAQCYVIEEQANYRFVATSELPPDGRLVVAPLGNRGRWIRESGLVGFAMLEKGTPRPEEGERAWIFADYATTHLTQFKAEGGIVRYVGQPPRLTLIYGAADLRVSSQVEVFVVVANQARVVAAGHLAHSGNVSVAGVALLMPGDTLVLRARGAINDGTGSLRVVLA